MTTSTKIDRAGPNRNARAIQLAAQRWFAKHANRWSSADREDGAAEVVARVLANGCPADEREAIVYTHNDCVRYFKDQGRKTARRARVTAELAGSEGEPEAWRTVKPRGRPAVQRFSAAKLDELRAAVRRECLKDFAKRFGKPWDPKYGGCVRVEGDPNAGEREARELFEQLRAAMHGIAGLLELGQRRPGATRSRLQRGGECLTFLEGWFPEALGRELTRPIFERGPDWSRLVDSPRWRFVSAWDRYNMLGLPGRDDGSARFLDAHEFAIVWLLAGGWPEALQFPRGGVTARKVIDTERSAMARCLERGAGQKEAFPGSLRRGE